MQRTDVTLKLTKREKRTYCLFACLAQNQTSGVFAFFVYLPDSKGKECIQNKKNNKSTVATIRQRLINTAGTLKILFQNNNHASR